MIAKGPAIIAKIKKDTIPKTSDAIAKPCAG